MECKVISAIHICANMYLYMSLDLLRLVSGFTIFSTVDYYI